jgi:hypothetical protein
MKRAMLSLVVLLVSVAAIAQESTPSWVKIPHQWAMAEMQPVPKLLNVWIKLPAVIPSNGIVSGTTNLPDGTIFNLYLSTATPNENFDWTCMAENGANAVVFHGSFRRTLTGGKECLKPGTRYIFQVVMKAPFLQPASVIAVIGKDGSNLTGKLVSGSGIGRDVKASIPVEVQ